MRTNTEQSHTQRGLCLLILLLAVFLTANTAFLPVVSYADTATERFTVSGADYPSTLTEGSSYGLKGTITAAGTISRVEIGVVNASTGKYMPDAYYNATGVNAKVFDIRSADSAIRFGTLPAGEYYYRVTAYDNAGAEKVLDALFTVTSKSASLQGWHRENGQWYYLKPDGSRAVSEWVKYGTLWCYIDSNGVMAANKWVKSGGVWYYLKANGYMAASEWIHDGKGWCYLDGRGRLMTSRWLLDNGVWYYLKSSGYRAVNEWARASKGWCYLNSDGEMVVDSWVRSGGIWYYMKSDGYMAAGEWIQDGKGRCYMGSGGELLSGRWFFDEDDDEWYYLKSNGYMAVNSWAKASKGWCYMGSDGRQVFHRWVYDADAWYYIKSDGYMAANEWGKATQGWCYLGGNGKMVQSRWIESGGAWYYLKADGYMAANSWAKATKGWCYLGSNGRMVTSKWINDKGEDYYLKADGYMAANEWACDTTGWRWLGANGKVVKSTWIEENGQKYYVNENGYRLDSSGKIVAPDTILSYDASLIAAIGKQPYSGPCGLYSMAYCRVVIDGQFPLNGYSSYKARIIQEYGGGSSYAHWGRAGGTMQYYSTNASLYKAVYDEITAGRPCIMNCYNPPTGNNHFVAVIGYVRGTTRSNVTLSSFIVLDPATGTLRYMSDTSYTAPTNSPYGPEIVRF